MSIDEVLRAQDFRVTRARTLVWQVLDEAQSHPVQPTFCNESRL